MPVVVVVLLLVLVLVLLLVLGADVDEVVGSATPFAQDTSRMQ